MAKLRGSLLVASISGQARGINFQQLGHGGSNILKSFNPGPGTPPRTTTPPAPRCDCQAFKYCDQIYQQMTAAQRLVWRNAVTRPATSPYDLWMHECLTLVIHGQRPPDAPGPNGGWSAINAIPGTTRPGLTICGWVAPPPPPPPDWGWPLAPPWPNRVFGLVPYEWHVYNDGPWDICLTLESTFPPQYWMMPGYNRADLYRRALTSDLQLTIVGTYGACLWTYRPASYADGQAGRFSYVSRTGGCRPGLSPILKIQLYADNAECPGGGGGE